jgi:hypothetical protein
LNRGFEKGDRTQDQHDAYCIAAWMSRADRNGSLAGFLKPDLPPDQRVIAEIEGWILGMPGGSPLRTADTEDSKFDSLQSLH